VIFKQKKGFATIRIGKIYHSMVWFQPPYHETAPLRKSSGPGKKVPLHPQVSSGGGEVLALFIP
jgi:hypothetical protein